jgi:UDP-N-acetylglucosamine 2-epimerase (non-hydrolysing)
MKVLFVFGTRPEAIKMAPMVNALRNEEQFFETRVCISAQHREMLDQVIRFFEIGIDHDLDLMRPGQTLYALTSRLIDGIQKVIEQERPDLVMVQGDTTTAFAGALCAYYCQVKVAHIEAGLRSGNPMSPFPEEANRKMIAALSHYHFAPTENARANLEREGISNGIYVVGNTVIDALFMGLKMVEQDDHKYSDHFRYLDLSKKTVLVTGHRRESFGEKFRSLSRAIASIADEHSDIEFVYPVHLNPEVQVPVYEILGNKKNIHLINPLPYPELIWLLNHSTLILTDSGGIQEEAPALGKPVLVMRDVTERTEGIEAGTAKLVGTDEASIIKHMKILLSDYDVYEKMANAINPYGDGNSSERIKQILMNEGLN